MHEFFTILVDIILPVFILISLGFWLHRKFQLDLYTLAKINIYYLVPSIIFTKLYNVEFSLYLFLQIFLFFVLQIAFLYFLTWLVNKIFHHEKGLGTAFSNSVIFYNSGNYGVPVNDLVFRHDTFAMSIQVIVLTLQNIFTFSYGVFALQSVNGRNLKTILSYFKMPVFYAMALGILFNVLNIQVPSFVLVPVNYISDALIAIALLTLGAQVANLKIQYINLTIFFSLFFRLLVGPAISFVIIWLFHIEGIMAQAMILSASMPTAVNSAIIAQEYNNEPEYAAQVVLLSTLFSSLTVTMVIYLVRLFL
ncbi:AEC family transporter [Tepidibacillus infernus]|uniref:Permease n=1 Tax=Tepidibacillus decaturensis TaxID=1413211 RepID=A0A135L1B7_9BACI|nr:MULTISPECIES: AEC family transporter [Tepidibacillus]KXG42755.1 permease [Tepidibacillus decaturensis]GBF12345.1 putative transporter YfdV [Tepidibacillus sp. HK-1]